MLSKPQDEVRAFATRSSKQEKKGIPGLAPAPQPVTKPRSQQAPSSQQQQPKPKPKHEVSVSSATESMSKLKVSADSNSASAAPQQPPAAEVPVDPKVEAAKKIKALKKKLREIEEIQMKKVEELTPEQVQKLAKKAEIESDIQRFTLLI